MTRDPEVYGTLVSWGWKRAHGPLDPRQSSFFTTNNYNLNWDENSLSEKKYASTYEKGIQSNPIKEGQFFFLMIL